MNHLEELGFFPFGQPNVYKHERAPIRAVISHENTRCRLIYDIGEDFLSSLICDVDNEKHEVLMGLTDMKRTLQKLGTIK